MSSLMRCPYNPFDEDPPNLSFPFNPDAPTLEQVANLIFRFSEYQKMHKHINRYLSTISSDHYKICDTKTLIGLKQPIQVLLYAREALLKIEEAFERDINLCHDYITKLQQEGRRNDSGDENRDSDENIESSK